MVGAMGRWMAARTSKFVVYIPIIVGYDNESHDDDDDEDDDGRFSFLVIELGKVVLDWKAGQS